MTYLKEALIQKEKELLRFAKQLQHTNAPISGAALDICCTQTRTQYYLRTPSNIPGKYERRYLRRSQMPFIRELAQTDYELDALRLINKQLRQIRSFLSRYDEDALDHLYKERIEARRDLITPLILPIDEYIASWYNDTPDRINTFPPRTPIRTDHGEIVRSKSEKILADKFHHLGIPYKYECPLNLNEHSPNLLPDWIYPDFTLLNRRTRKQYYWEHNGMMGNESYSTDAINKIDRYQQAGIFPGEQLLLSYESDTHPLDLASVECLIEHYLL